MHLKRIEMSGFKSFAERTVIELDPGVITIVGPNGCGKSNVADALRWVFGEQNPRILRGNEMQDVIFNGTDTRKPIGRAEVSVTFDSCEGVLPTEFHEVTVTRRLFRSGESQYLINQNSCLLRDIKELFMGTGIGTNAYFLLEQGKIDMLLSAKPEDRRSVFEEAAGIMKYKIKKKASLQRLELTQVNLLRLADIIREVKRQIISLERQAGKARRYQEARDELKKLEIKLARRDFEDRTRELKETEGLLAKLSQNRDSLQEKTSELQRKIQEVERSHKSIFDERSNLEKSDLELYHKIQNATGEMSLLKERLSEFESRMTSDRDEVNQAERRCVDLKNQYKIEEDDRNKFLQANLDHKLGLDSRKKSLETILSEYEVNQEALGSSKNLVIDLQQQEAQLKNQMMVHHHRQKDLVLRKEKLLTEREQLGLHRKEKELEKAQVQQISETHSRNLSEMQSHLKDRIDEKEKLEKERQIILKEMDHHKENHLRNTVRLEAAKEMGITDPSSKHSLEGDDKTFESVINIPFEIRKALKAVLGAKLGCVLKSDRSQIQKRNSIVFFSMDTVLPSKERADFSTLPGFVGFASDLLKFEAVYSPVVQALIGDIVIVRDFESLRQIPDTWLGHFRFVNLEGDWLDQDGTWGFNGTKDEHMIDFPKVEKEIHDALGKMNLLGAQNESLDQKMNELNHQITDGQEKAWLKELELANVSGNLGRITGKLKDLEDEAWSLEQEENSYHQEIEDLEKMVSNISTNLTQMSHRSKDAVLQITQRESILHDLESQKENALVELAEIKVMSRSIEDEERRFSARLNEIGSSLSDLEKLISKRNEDLTSWTQKKRESEARIVVLNQDVERWLGEKENLKMRKEEVDRLVEEITQSIQQDQEELIVLTKDLELLREEFSSLEVKKVERLMQKENIFQRIRDKYDLNIMEFSLEEENFDLVVVQQRINDLQEKLRSMGDVNLVAIQEFDEYRSRYDFLMKQQDDLIHAKDDLTKAIQKINTTIRELFLETFEKIRGTFNDLFRKLFGGGRAVLELLDDGDVLECGINISAQPPGKKLQTISLLSGGERTLTALALLLAIFRVRPSPFCFMDEMDAALDESNILRFLSVLDEFKTQTQFILITHNKRTVSVADIVYGVTMEESGVSKLVSIRLPSPAGEAQSEALAG